MPAMAKTRALWERASAMPAERVARGAKLGKSDMHVSEAVYHRRYARYAGADGLAEVRQGYKKQGMELHRRKVVGWMGRDSQEVPDDIFQRSIGFDLPWNGTMG